MRIEQERALWSRLPFGPTMRIIVYGDAGAGEQTGGRVKQEDNVPASQGDQAPEGGHEVPPLQWPAVPPATGLTHGRWYGALGLLVPAFLFPVLYAGCAPAWTLEGQPGGGGFYERAEPAGAFIGLCLAALILAILLVAFHRASLVTQLQLVRDPAGADADDRLLLVRVVNNGRSTVRPLRVGVRMVHKDWGLSNRVGSGPLKPGDDTVVRFPLDSVTARMGLNSVVGIANTGLCTYVSEPLDLLARSDDDFLPVLNEPVRAEEEAEPSENQPSTRPPWYPSGDLQKARSLAADGKYRKSVDRLWRVEALARTDIHEARALLDTAKDLRPRVTGSKERDCDELVLSAEAIIERLSEAGGGGPMAYLPGCRVLRSWGLVPLEGEKWDVTLRYDSIVISRDGEEDVRVRLPVGPRDRFLDSRFTRVKWGPMFTALEIGGPGARERGGDLSSATWTRRSDREGDLIKQALARIEHRAALDTVICLTMEYDQLFLLSARPLPATLWDPFALQYLGVHVIRAGGS